MSTLKTLLYAALVAAGAGLAVSAPAKADSSGFYIGPDGVQIYVGDDRYYRDRYYRDDYYRYNAHYGPYHQYRPYRHYRSYCYNRTGTDWRYGHRVRYVDRICVDRFGRARLVDRDYYRGYYRDRYRDYW